VRARNSLASRDNAVNVLTGILINEVRHAQADGGSP
jgi:hypothetical protein